MTPRILISIVSWRYLDNVAKIVSAIESSLSDDDYLVVIETGGQKSEDVERYIAEHNNMQIIYSEANEGFAASHALSVKIMQEKGLEGILLLNPDIELRDNHIKVLKDYISALNNDPVLGCPVFFRTEEDLEVEYLGFPVPEDIESCIINSLKQKKEIPSLIYNVKDIHGCFMYVPSTVVRKYGWMDTMYFLYGEENEYLHRICKNGGSVKIATDLYVVHENGGTFDNEQLKCVREYYRTRNRLYNNYIINGRKSLLKFNFRFVFKYIIGRYLFRIKSFRENNKTYYNFLGHIHFIFGKRGKTLDPNNYV